MASVLNAELIRDVVTELVNNNVMFTAFEVSLAVKELAKQRGVEVEKHTAMKEEVHRQVEQYVKNGLYDGNCQDVGAPIKAIVYFPVNGGDPSKYIPLKRFDTTPASPNSVVASVTALNPQPPVGAGTPLTVGRTPDARGTLCIPANLLREIGFEKKNAAYVYSVTNTSGQKGVAVSPSLIPSLPLLTTYTVDDNVNVRVTNSTLKSGGLTAAGYKFEVASATVVITES